MSSVPPTFPPALPATAAPPGLELAVGLILTTVAGLIVWYVKHQSNRLETLERTAVSRAELSRHVDHLRVDVRAIHERIDAVLERMADRREHDR